MKHPLFFIFSLLPAFLTTNQEVVKTVTITADVHENLVSLDNLTNSLGGSVTFNEETANYIYLINEQEITLNLEFGYSLVNGEKEALLIETDEKTNLMTIQWQKPEMINEEIYVPIEYIERILGATYEDEEFTFPINDDYENVTTNEIEEESEKVDVIPNQPETNHPNSDNSSSNQGTTQSNPQQTPTTPSKPESKPENIKPSTPVKPEVTPEEEESEPESKPIQPEPEKPEDSIIEETEEEIEEEIEENPSMDSEEDNPSSENSSTDLTLENTESESTLSQDFNDLERIN